MNWFNLLILPISVAQLLALLLLLSGFFLSLKLSLARVEKPKKFRRTGLIIINLTATIGLTGLVLQPMKEQPETLKVRLFTDKSAPHLFSDEYPNYQLVVPRHLKASTFGTNKSAVNELELEGQNDNLQEIQLAQQIFIDNPTLKTMELVGNGLTQSQWRTIGNVNIEYRLPKLIQGFVDISWTHRLNLGEYLHVNGRFQSAEQEQFSELLRVRPDDILTVQLLDPVGDIVATTQALPSEYFALSAQPKVSGLHGYTIEVINKQKTIAKQRINFQVTQSGGLKILVIQSSPSFETRQFQNWAGEQGASLLIKTKISRNKYLSKSVNLNDRFDDAFSRELFSHFDLIVADGRGLTELSVTESNRLHDAIQDGAGLVIWADQDLFEKKDKVELVMLLEGIELSAINNPQDVSVYWSDNRDGLVSAQAPFSPAVAIDIKVDNTEIIDGKALVLSASGQVLVARKNYGLGKIAVSRLKETYRWVTSGDQAGHSHYWQSLIHDIARPAASITIELADKKPLNYINELQKVCTSGVEENSQLAIRARHEPELIQKLLLQPEVGEIKTQCGYFWPTVSGWYLAEVRDEAQQVLATSTFFIQDVDSWQAMLQQQKIRATLAKQAAYEARDNTDTLPRYRPINLWLFWWVFFISASAIWLERKLE